MRQRLHFCIHLLLSSTALNQIAVDQRIFEIFFTRNIMSMMIFSGSNISDTSDSVSLGYRNTEKRVENTTRSGVFLTSFTVVIFSVNKLEVFTWYRCCTFQHNIQRWCCYQEISGYHGPGTSSCKECSLRTLKQSNTSIIYE